ncbi:hypothetical protein Psuf_047260 [Phytohabitans suffuscus]|uniref:Fumarylacetoacetate hydrolase n=1 Tax=Phytohabitans suffuscus TaxID=624315 RepID=A0A6F8YMX9_9ACTN|nr:hypothetical protein [Phytohabitans suffuscus]BCB87413.1 hypothetical protein Psuf_047260 [Phytohabitans suffuscus]
MRLGNQDGRLVIVTGDEVVDVATASEGRFGPDPQSAYDDWDDFTAWAAQGPAPTGKLDEAALGPISPRPGRSSRSASTTPTTRPSPATRCPTTR